MFGRNIMRDGLTKAEFRQVIFLTLSLIVVFLSHLCRADTYGSSCAPVYSPEDKQRISDIETYVRQQALHGVTILPSEARSVVGWLSGGWHSVHLFGGGDATPSPAAASGTAAFTTQNDSDDMPMDVGSNIHHKGFLPTHDAMVMGVGVSKKVLSDKLQLTAHPFYGQNWRAVQGYWGTEMALNIAKQPDGMPWGKIAIGYVGGNEALTDHGRGIDVHGDVDLTEGWKFTSGVRQNSADGNSNYVMLRWKLKFD